MRRSRSGTVEHVVLITRVSFARSLMRPTKKRRGKLLVGTSVSMSNASAMNSPLTGNQTAAVFLCPSILPKTMIEPTFIPAGSDSLKLGFLERPPQFDCRVVEETLYQQLVKKIKTKKGWDKSGLNLDKYLTEPCEIDEEMYMYIGECVAPKYCSPWLTQGGDPETSAPSFNEEDDDVFYYMTVSEVNDRYYYLGILPEFRI